MTITTENNTQLKQLLSDNKAYVAVPKEGENVKGTVISISPREVLIDLQGYKTGMVRGYELQDVSNIYPDLKVGDEVESTVMELENNEGNVELSFRFAGKLRAAQQAFEAKKNSTTVEVKITDANRGGLMGVWMGMKGFLPVSQLSPENYPRVPGGDKGKILERLRSFIGNPVRVKILDCNPEEDKLIFSEKLVWEEEQKDLLAKYKIGDTVEGVITAVADFGVFVGFDGLEGLVHISEIAWQRIDNPSDLIKVGEKVRAKVLNIQGSKLFLSMKALEDDPWGKVAERYKMGQAVEGKILKVNPFGLFVELDAEIHGLAHVSELKITPGQPLAEQIKPGDQRTFKVVSIEPDQHRLGLSEKALDEPDVKAEPKAEEKTEEPKAEEVKAEEKTEEPKAEDGEKKEDVI